MNSAPDQQETSRSFSSSTRASSHPRSRAGNEPEDFRSTNSARNANLSRGRDIVYRLLFPPKILFLKFSFEIFLRRLFSLPSSYQTLEPLEESGHHIPYENGGKCWSASDGHIMEKGVVTGAECRAGRDGMFSGSRHVWPE